jgi:hypothetical protein
MDAGNILQVITLAVAGWTLQRVISQGEKIAAMDQKLSDLPCGDCKINHKNETEKKYENN